MPEKPGGEISDRPHHIRNFLIASAVHLLFFILIFRGPLSVLGVYTFQANLDPAKALSGMSEMQYITLPNTSAEARIVKQGFFPGWSHYAQGGTPLLGKMQCATFSPFNLPIYIIPLSLWPYALMLVVFLKSFFGFAFAYLYARWMRLGLFGAITAGMFFALAGRMIAGTAFTWFGVGAFLPLILLLIELYYRGHWGLALLALPWAMGLPFFTGHFESAIRIDISAAIYFLAHFWHEKASGRTPPRDRLVDFACVTGVAIMIALVQIWPGFEYVGESYSKVWHGWADFTTFETIGKHWSREDLPLFLGGMAALGFFVWTFRLCLRDTEEPWGSKGILHKVSAGALLALALACLTNIGLDDLLLPLKYSDPQNVTTLLIGFTMLFLAAWGWSNTERFGLKVLGWLAFGNLLVCIKTPVLANAISNLPVAQNFHNILYRKEINLALAVLAAFTLERWASSAAGDWKQKRRAALSACGIWMIFVAGYLASLPLGDNLTKIFPTGVYEKHRSPREIPGGIMGPEYKQTYRRHHSVAGWVSSKRPVSALHVALVKDNKVLSQVDKTSQLQLVGARQYFYAKIGIPEGVYGPVSIVAQVLYADGVKQILRMPKLIAMKAGENKSAAMLVLAGVLLLPAFFLLPPILVRPLGILLMVVMALQFDFPAIAADQVPFRLGGMEKIQEDRGVFRISSLEPQFLQAEYASMYGLSDIRTGGDAIDVLTMIYFSHLVNSFVSRPGEPAAIETALKLWGLANVKYLVHPPGKEFSHPGLEPYYKDSRMTVYKNKHFMPRALFFNRFSHLPLGDWRDWESRGKFLQPLASTINQKGIDPSRILLLNDLPVSRLQGSRAGAEASSVRIEKYEPTRIMLSVDAAEPGFVFLSDNHFPGWQAFVNGRKTDILRSWITFRAVEVPQGRSTVEFVYRPLLLRLLLWIFVALAVTWVYFYRRFRLDRPSFSSLAEDPSKKKGGKKQVIPLNDDPPGWDSAVMVEGLFFSGIGVCLLFWTLWSAFIYQGGIQNALRGGEWFLVHILACLLLLGFAAAVWKDFRRERHSV